jgi:hypothetical protein
LRLPPARVVPGPRLVKVGSRLVARPTVGPDFRPSIDIAALVEGERDGDGSPEGLRYGQTSPR